MENLLGNVFRPGQKACLCQLRVDGAVLIAEPRDPEISDGPYRFPLKDEFLSFGGDGGTQLILKNAEGHTLYCERSKLQAILAGHGNRAFQDRLKTEEKRVVNLGRVAHLALLGFILGCGVLVGLVVLAMNWGVDRVVDQIPIAWEEGLGDMVARSGMGPELEDPRLTEPVKAIIDRLAAAEPGQPYTFKLHIVQNPQLNAFAAPGGHVVVFTGLLEKTEDAGQLAGVLAHEFQHVFHRHGLRNMVHAVKWQIVAALLMGDVGSVQHVVMANAPRFLTLQYGRSREEEADVEGIKLLEKAHIDPHGMIAFFEIMQQNETIQIPEFLSDHPETAHRIEELKEWVAEHPGDDYQPLDVDWKGLKEALEDGNSSSTEE